MGLPSARGARGVRKRPLSPEPQLLLRSALVDHGLGQDVGKPAVKAGHDVSAVQLVRCVQLPHVTQRTIDNRASLLWVDDPNQAYSRLKVLTDLVQDVPGAVS